MLKKIFIYILLLSVLLLPGCGKKQEKAAEADASVLHAAVVKASDSFTLVNGAEIKGIEPEIIAKIAELKGLALDLKVVETRDELYTGIEAGSIDVGFGRIPETDGALKSYDISRAYGRGGLFFITKRFDYTDSIRLIKSGNIGVMDTVRSISGQVPGIDGFTISDYTDIEALARDVAAGSIAIGIADERDALKVISDTVQAQEVLKGPRESYVAVMKKDSAFKEAADQAIAAYYDARMGGNAAE